MLDLKKGAFFNNNNLLVNILEYKSEFDPMIDSYGQLLCSIGVLA